MAKIKKITAREVIDSRGYPTVEATVELSDGVFGVSSVPSGAVQGTYEALELRDGDETHYEGHGVTKAIDIINTTINDKIAGMEATAQQQIDQAMIGLDGTQNKSKLGANTILSVSQAVMKASARSSLLPLPLYIRQFVSGDHGNKMPIPMFNLIEGGKHGGSPLNFQEYMLIPATSKSYPESLEMGIQVYHELKKRLNEGGRSTLVADEGGYSPNVNSNAAAIGILRETIEASGYSYSLDAFVGLDVAATSLLDGKNYKLIDRAVPYTPEDLVEYYQTLIAEYSLIYLEDPFGEDDWESWKLLASKIKDKMLLVGDDMTATNPYRLQLALDNKVLGGLVIKPNQIGTVTEAIAVAEIARYTGLKIIVSGRSGETIDSFVADFAVGIGADYVKFGAPARERIAKYNKLLQIDADLKNF